MTATTDTATTTAAPGTHSSGDGQALIRRALAAARETRRLEVGPDLLGTIPAVFADQFGRERPAALVTDRHTLAAAGEAVLAAFAAAGHPTVEPFVFDDPALYAEHKYVEQLQAWLATHDAVPVAVGSGTINDVTKLAAHRTGRQYLSVATAASMDGYTAFGASITFKGSKQTFDCPAPQAVVADLDVIAAAPPILNAAGYADLLAKVTAGADWIVADALGIEPIDPTAWDLVQVPLMASLADPAGVRRGDIKAVGDLTRGLMMGGFAMQWTKSSRPASGAEHQFSHLWDMQHHTHGGAAPSHGFKVAVGTVAVARLYEQLLGLPLDELDIDGTVATAPTAADTEADIVRRLGDGELADKARLEMTAKSITPAALRDRLRRLREVWPTLRERLRAHLPPAAKLAEMLAAAGAPSEPEQVGISRDRLRDSYHQAYLIRRRFTVLDLAVEAGVLDASLGRLFPPLRRSFHPRARRGTASLPPGEGWGEGERRCDPVPP
ncbi:MAG: egsA 2 [Phycisphaerales bacterium]|nr:egsA 2 [Phycisphaerales bacterium]